MYVIEVDLKKTSYLMHKITSLVIYFANMWVRALRQAYTFIDPFTILSPVQRYV